MMLPWFPSRSTPVLYSKFKTLATVATLACMIPAAWKIHAFSDIQCLKADFQTEISHRGFPLGLTQRVLTIEKKGCQLSIDHQKWKFYKQNWIVDVCREPVHLKKSLGSVEVIKKAAPCSGPQAQANAFCQHTGKLKNLIQDDGLIFASGDKEALTSEHGKVYCAYLLFKAYTERDIVFSRSREYSNILEEAQAMPSPSSDQAMPTPSPPPGEKPGPTEILPFDEKDGGSF